MDSDRVTPFPGRKTARVDLLDRARTGRQSALLDRMVTIVQTSTDGATLTEHRFPSRPRLADLLARLGGDARIVGIRTEPYPSGNGPV